MPAVRRLLCLAPMLLGTACGGSGASIHSDGARAALETALEAWKTGGKPATLATADPPILVVDSEWTNGRKLEGFRVLDEIPSEADRRFNVALRIKGQAQEAEVQYVILGGQPLSVFRGEDYERVINMDDNPAPKKGTAGTRGRR